MSWLFRNGNSKWQRLMIDKKSLIRRWRGVSNESMFSILWKLESMRIRTEINRCLTKEENEQR